MGLSAGRLRLGAGRLLPLALVLGHAYGFVLRANMKMCICVNCALVDRCTAYHTVEAKHGQPHLSQFPDFTPRQGSPTVEIIVFNSTREVELDVTKCDDYVEDIGRWTKMMPTGTLLKHGFDPSFVPT